MLKFPNKGLLKTEVECIKQDTFDSSGSQSRIKTIFKNLFVENPDDKTSVFDFIDDFWLNEIHSRMKKVAHSELYSGDGTDEYRIAYICVDINLAHKFIDGNKRSSILALIILALYNEKDNFFHFLSNDDDKYIYNLAKKIAREGVEGRENNIRELTAFLTNPKNK